MNLHTSHYNFCPGNVFSDRSLHAFSCYHRGVHRTYQRRSFFLFGALPLQPRASATSVGKSSLTGGFIQVFQGARRPHRWIRQLGPSKVPGAPWEQGLILLQARLFLGQLKMPTSLELTLLIDTPRELDTL